MLSDVWLIEYGYYYLLFCIMFLFFISFLRLDMIYVCLLFWELGGVGKENKL